MKKKMQKYLSGSNEGFSLVELIIVIAIMAILVGVVALAVIPNLERSRESKDLATLDSTAKALTAAVATAGSKAGEGTGKIKDGAWTSKPTAADGMADMATLFEQQIEVSTLKLVSQAAGDGEITLTWNVTVDGDGTAHSVIKVSANGGNECQYAKDASGGTAKLEVNAGSEE